MINFNQKSLFVVKTSILFFSLSIGIGYSTLFTTESVSAETIALATVSSPEISTTADQLFEEGVRLYDVGQYSQAIIVYEKVLKIRREIGDQFGIGRSLNAIGLAYAQLQQSSQAISYYQQALTIFRQLRERNREAMTLNNLGGVYNKLGRNLEALETYQQALDIFLQTRNRLEQANIFHNLGTTFYNLGQFTQAMTAYQKAQILFHEAKETLNEGTTLHSIGTLYSILGQYQKARESFEQALPLLITVNNRLMQGQVYSGIGLSYARQNQYGLAITAYQQAIVHYQNVGDRYYLGRTRNLLGVAYTTTKDYPQALTQLNQALETAQKNDDRWLESAALDSLGDVYRDLHQPTKAFTFYQRAIAISQAIGNRWGQAAIFSNLGNLYAQQSRPELAILFYKESVSVTEAIRKDLRASPKDQQESYTETVADTYRRLADLLLQQDRVLEAQQILDILKVQELDDYLRDLRGTAQPIAFLQPELEILQKYRELQKNAIEIGSELADLRKLDNKNALTPAQQQRLAHLTKVEIDINAQFNAFIDSDPIQKLTAELIRVTRNQNLNLEDLAGLQTDLRPLNAALLYPLILEDRLELIITTPNSPPLRRGFKVKREDLNRKIQAFRSALGNRQDNAQTLAQELYSWLIQPIAADLKQANVTTIIYAPDGQLRYIPLAALHDGNQWLIQKYRVQNITARAVSKLDTPPQSEKRIFAAAFGAKQVNISVEGESFHFDGLPFAAQEVRSLTQTFPSTVSLFDQGFNRDALFTRMNSFNVVHLATHGKFLIGKPDSSFLLMGDGQSINLKEIKNLPMGNVDLVVLSACETGLGITNRANGIEVLGLGYQFQRAGAKAAISSLWSVHDGGTQRFMDIFYGLLQQGMPKAEALQQAQIALINGDFTASGKLRSNFIIKTAPGQTTIPTNLKHPFYWAPFILIGNGL
jgi:CHAT domain-containing protein/Tfp pilus assembly protein PilF